MPKKAGMEKWKKKRRQEYLEMKFVCSEKSKKSRVHFPACCYTTKTRPKAERRTSCQIRIISLFKTYARTI